MFFLSTALIQLPQFTDLQIDQPQLTFHFPQRYFSDTWITVVSTLAQAFPLSYSILPLSAT